MYDVISRLCTVVCAKLPKPVGNGELSRSIREVHWSQNKCLTEEQGNAYDLKLFKRASCLWKVRRREENSRSSSSRTARLRDQKSVWAETDFKTANYLLSVTLMKANKQTVLKFTLYIFWKLQFAKLCLSVWQFAQLLSCCLCLSF